MPGKLYTTKVRAVIVTFLLLVFSYILLLVNRERIRKQVELVSHTYDLIFILEELSAYNQELNYRYHSYLVTADPLAKQQHTLTASNIKKELRKLATMVGDNVSQLNRQKLLDSKFSNKISTQNVEIAKASSKIREEKADSIITSSLNNPQTLEISSHIDTMQHAENLLLQQRSAGLDRFTNYVQVMNVVSLLLAICFAIFSFLAYRREFFVSREVRRENEAYKKQLEKEVTDLAKANEEIVQFKTQEKFASTGRVARTIAHEIRNPLTNINLAVAQMKELLPDDEEAEMMVGMITRNSGRINELISNLLNATRFIEIDPQKQSIAKVMDDALDLAKDRLILKKVEVIKKYQKELCDVELDADKMRIAFLNLIVNAIEAMPETGGKLELQIRSDADGKCEVLVKDNGIGMDEDTKAKLFEPFFTSKEKGNGLGLTNTQNIILTHNGEIEVDSLPEKGTQFKIKLPQSYA